MIRWCVCWLGNARRSHKTPKPDQRANRRRQRKPRRQQGQQGRDFGFARLHLHPRAQVFVNAAQGFRCACMVVRTAGHACDFAQGGYSTPTSASGPVSPHHSAKRCRCSLSCSMNRSLVCKRRKQKRRIRPFSSSARFADKWFRRTLACAQAAQCALRLYRVFWLFEGERAPRTSFAHSRWQRRRRHPAAHSARPSAREVSLPGQHVAA